MWNNHISPLKRIDMKRLQWSLIKPWIGVAGLVGLGLLPRPECGAPMIIHFWPVAVVLALRNLLRERKKKHSSLDKLNSYIEELSANLEINQETGENQ
jgi:hypothetical protein